MVELLCSMRTTACSVQYTHTHTHIHTHTHEIFHIHVHIHVHVHVQFLYHVQAYDETLTTFGTIIYHTGVQPQALLKL